MLRTQKLGYKGRAVLKYGGKSVLVVDYGAADAAQRLSAIEQAYPNGEEELRRSGRGTALFFSYRVERDDLLAANPSATVDPVPVPGLTPAELETRG